MAIELARRQIPFRLIDAGAAPFEGSRGKGIQPRTLEIFDDLGVIAPILTVGALYPKFQIHVGPFSLSPHISQTERTELKTSTRISFPQPVVGRRS
jgi:2-polyprenyl-6-methoxyphenol hydroxylase-like FAD-dependent oxidoreductase